MHGGTCRCGCSYYEPDDGTDGPRGYPGLVSSEDYEGRYSPAGGYRLDG